MSAQPTSTATPPCPARTPAVAMVSPQWIFRVVTAVAMRPTLWAAAIRQVGRLAPRGWWRRRPFLPLPAPDYLAFRNQTMYGGSGQVPDPGDVCIYLQWCRDFPRQHPSRVAVPNLLSAPAGES